MENTTTKSPIFTETIPAGKRTYHVDVKTSREGVKYLSIAETKRKDDGSYDRNSVIILKNTLKTSLLR